MSWWRDWNGLANEWFCCSKNGINVKTLQSIWQMDRWWVVGTLNIEFSQCDDFDCVNWNWVELKFMCCNQIEWKISSAIFSALLSVCMRIYIS